MPSGLRRAHTKSRNGCGQCKKRRIKCDEQPPRCSNCRKRQVRCDYEQLGCPPTIRATSSPESDGNPPGNVPSATSNAHLEPSPAAVSEFRSVLPPPDLNLRDLQLMHHWTSSTSLTLSPLKVPDAEHMWQITIPKEAQSHEYLMRSILAMSALHIAHLQPSTRPMYTYIAQAHHDKALTLFRASVTHLTPANCTAAIAFAMLLVMFTFGLPLISDTLPLPDPIDSFLHVLSVLRGSWALFESVRPWVLQGPIGVLPAKARSIPLVPLQERTVQALDFLSTFNASSADSDADKSVYNDAILHLRLCFMSVSRRPGSWFRMIVCPLSLSEPFFALAEQKRPMALAILAHWCIPIHHAPHCWFVQDWAERVAAGIAREIDPACRPAMRWPLEEIGIVADQARYGS